MTIAWNESWNAPSPALIKRHNFVKISLEHKGTGLPAEDEDLQLFWNATDIHWHILKIPNYLLIFKTLPLTNYDFNLPIAATNDDDDTMSLQPSFFLVRNWAKWWHSRFIGGRKRNCRLASQKVRSGAQIRSPWESITVEKALPLAKGIEERKRRDTSSQETHSSQGVPRVPKEFPLPQREICGVSETSVNCSEERTLKFVWSEGILQVEISWHDLPRGKDGSSFFGRGWGKLLGKVIGMWAVLCGGARVNQCLLFELHGISAENGGCTQENAHWFSVLESKHISLQKPSSIFHSDCIRCTQMPLTVLDTHLSTWASFKTSVPHRTKHRN